MNPSKPEDAVEQTSSQESSTEHESQEDGTVAVPEILPVSNENTEELDDSQESEDDDTEADNDTDEDRSPMQTPETAQALGIVQIEEYINQQMTDISKLREEMRLVKSTVDDAFQNDAQYRELEQKSKEAAKVKNTYKKQMMNDPAVADQSNKLDGMKSEMRDMSVALSDYLREYNRLSGMTQFETRDGEVLEIVNVFKLVKKKE